MKKSNFAKHVATVSRLPQFEALSPANQRKVIAAVNRGRRYLSDAVNGTDAVASLHYTLKHNAKMTDLISLSTSVIANPICAARRNDSSSVCAYCFSAAMSERFGNIDAPFIANTEILRGRLLTEKEMPIILSKSGLFRIEALADVSNLLQAANYLRIAAANPWQKCAIWTKNPAFYHAAIQSGIAKKPANLTIIYSSSKVNEISPIPEKYAYFIDKVFTVYNQEGARGVNINCGARSCAKCARCYTKGTGVYVNELLK